MPASSALRASRISSTRKCTLCSERRRSPRISSARKRCRMYARVKRLHAAQSHSGSSGRRSARNSAALDVQPPVAREHGAVAPHPRRRHAVEQVHAAAHALHEILREAHAHQVAWAVFRKHLVHVLEDAVHVGLGLAHGQSADAEALPVAHVADGRGRLSAQVGVDAALHDRERAPARAGREWDRRQLSCSNAVRQRASQRRLRSLASRATSGSLWPGIT